MDSKLPVNYKVICSGTGASFTNNLRLSDMIGYDNKKFKKASLSLTTIYSKKAVGNFTGGHVFLTCNLGNSNSFNASNGQRSQLINIYPVSSANDFSDRNLSWKSENIFLNNIPPNFPIQFNFLDSAYAARSDFSDATTTIILSFDLYE